MGSSKPISIKNLHVLFNGDRSKHLHVLENISFTLDADSFVTIIGPSGCGKSTLFRLISGLPTKDSCEIGGEIKIFGKEPRVASEDRDIGLILQKPTLLEWRSVAKNMLLPLEIMGYEKEKGRKKVNKLLKILELEPYAHYRPSELSGGMQQKVSIGRALAYNPELLLMDEPFAALDEVNRRKMNDEIIRIWKEMEKTILFVTHNIQEAVYLSQKVIVLSKKPSRIYKIVDIDLEYPRSKVEASNKYYKYIKEIREYLNEATV